MLDEDPVSSVPAHFAGDHDFVAGRESAFRQAASRGVRGTGLNMELPPLAVFGDGFPAHMRVAPVDAIDRAPKLHAGIGQKIDVVRMVGLGSRSEHQAQENDMIDS